MRAKAVEALDKTGAVAAEVAVPGPVRALRDDDDWVSALAAEALGEMGESADEAVPALIHSLRHGNPLVQRLHQRSGVEDDPKLRKTLARLVERLGSQPAACPGASGT